MIDTLYNNLFTAAMCFLALIAFAYLVRAVIGPKFSDRILAVNSIQTIIILIICILSVFQGENYIVDIALIYAMLGFVTVVIVCKAYLRSHHKDRANDLENIKREVRK
ncbi:MAG: sodium:proton antiporter [Oscillospiraceae bacterium]|nr:sodium:proton antiporter [Oscillospiraceae bacterium]